jgi:AsmA family protein
MELSKMFRGEIRLKGRGNTTAQMLASSSGDLSLLMGQGQISNLLLELPGLDGAEIIKFLLRGDKNVKLRCAAAAFDVKDGLMTSRALVLDTEDTVVWGDGHVNFGTEATDLYFRPYPKDTSILALGAINPLLALAATVETGPGEDADCRATLRVAASPSAEAPSRGQWSGPGAGPRRTAANNKDRLRLKT